MKHHPKPMVEPPEHLSLKSKTLWADLIKECQSSGRQELLLVALEARDRSEQARLAIATEGLTSTTEATGAVHLHPLVRVERESKQLFSKIMQQLGLSFRNNSW